MKNNFKIVKVNSDYCDYLRKFDSKVPYNAGEKELRPFLGILFMVDNVEYFAPLSSPKAKHASLTNKIDLVKIDGGKLGVVNFNNMIPVTNKNYSIFDLNADPSSNKELKRQKLLNTQLRWLNRHNKDVKSKAITLYNSFKHGTLPGRIKNRCCNFALLEEKCKEYNK